MDFLSSLISPISSLFGGLMGQQNQANIAQQNIAMQEEFAKNGIQWKVADAKAAGINPLAALGVNTNSFSNIVGSNDLGAGVAAAGQDLGRAAMASAAKPTRADVLNEQLLQAKIANVNADTVKSQAEASRLARNFASPSSGPGINFDVDKGNFNYTGSPNNKLPALFQDYAGRHGEKVTLLSDEAARTQFGAGSNVATGLPIATGLIQENAANAWDATAPDLVRPDVWRGVDSSQYVPF